MPFFWNVIGPQWTSCSSSSKLLKNCNAATTRAELLKEPELEGLCMFIWLACLTQVLWVVCCCRCMWIHHLRMSPLIHLKVGQTMLSWIAWLSPWAPAYLQSAYKFWRTWISSLRYNPCIDLWHPVCKLIERPQSLWVGSLYKMLFADLLPWVLKHLLSSV